MVIPKKVYLTHVLRVILTYSLRICSSTHILRSAHFHCLNIGPRIGLKYRLHKGCQLTALRKYSPVHKSCLTHILQCPSLPYASLGHFVWLEKWQETALHLSISAYMSMLVVDTTSMHILRTVTCAYVHLFHQNMT